MGAKCDVIVYEKNDDQSNCTPLLTVSIVVESIGKFVSVPINLKLMTSTTEQDRPKPQN
jgi:hypothetical protein